jgi:hypothetical protein
LELLFQLLSGGPSREGCDRPFRAGHTRSQGKSNRTEPRAFVRHFSGSSLAWKRETDVGKESRSLEVLYSPELLLMGFA